jgi:hypothetical protein
MRLAILGQPAAIQSGDPIKQLVEEIRAAAKNWVRILITGGNHSDGLATCPIARTS